MQLPKHGYVEAVAMIVDINRFESMVSKGWDDNVGLFVRDVLIGGVTIVEKNLGEVVAFMGDAFLAVLPDPSRAGHACLQIAKDLRKINEYVSLAQEESANAWSFATGGCGLKLALEIGIIEVNTITSRFLGEQALLTGRNINYAARISSASEGNRCVIGPELAKVWPYGPLEGPYEYIAKHNLKCAYFKFEMSDIWTD
jgi:class 3 adenylate cyclase